MIRKGCGGQTTAKEHRAMKAVLDHNVIAESDDIVERGVYQ